ncbi:hypothetical protein KIH87_18690 [Paraneptunicella aestuarii]|uniref:hypothetical protein n=1 Tax=Paraneptunicella aestuarii TaxID=2831148 RepID=UPI001E4B40B0|nr:hypothetical protein [Paraneptunicella aestuarii]UAA38661.1 hypothetical protein KIH87_18690 [Paraneptunicella aestuarii]
MNLRKIICMLAFLLTPVLATANEDIQSLNESATQSYCWWIFCTGNTDIITTTGGVGDPPVTIMGGGVGHPPGTGND